MAPTYDVFLSFKNSTAEGKPTPDSALAHEIYRHLTARGLTVFFSAISLESMGVTAYKQAIDDALESAQILVAVGTSRQNLESQWVRYEWDGFINDILTGAKPAGRVITYADAITPASLPRALRQYTVVRHGAGALDQLANYIRNGLVEKPKSNAVSEAPAPDPIPIPPPKHDVFLCYSAQDAATAEAICRKLEEVPFRCWIYQRDTLPGLDYASQIVRAIRGSRIFLLVFSTHASKSAQIKHELILAHESGIQILPVCLDDEPFSPEVKYCLGTSRWLDARNSPVQQHLDNVADVVSQLLANNNAPTDR
jgi:hypothetical protein